MFGLSKFMLFVTLLFFSLHDLSCLPHSSADTQLLLTLDLFLCVRVQTCKCWRLMWNWGLYGTGGYDRRWKLFCSSLWGLYVSLCRVERKANMCALDYMILLSRKLRDTLVVPSCGWFWRLSCPCAVLSVKANMCALGLHGSEATMCSCTLILCYISL